MIDEVVPDSPAAKAGLKKFDVLTKVDDQLVIDPHQLAVLIRTHKPNDEVKLSIIHEAAASTVSVALVEKDLPPIDGGGPGRGGPEGMRGMHGPGMMGMHGLGMRGGRGGPMGPMGMRGRGGFGMHGGMGGPMGMHRGGPMGGDDMEGAGGPGEGRGGFGPRGGNEEGPDGPMGGRRGFGGFAMRGEPGGGPDGPEADGGPDEDGPGHGPGMHRRGRFGPPHGPGGPTTKPTTAPSGQP